MDDTNQIEPPPSFVALFTSPSGHRLLEPASTVRRRYELCEDLAQTLTEQAGLLAAGSGSERQVLDGMRQALAAPGSAVTPQEAQWVVTRLAELLGWDAGRGD